MNPDGFLASGRGDDALSVEIRDGCICGVATSGCRYHGATVNMGLVSRRACWWCRGRHKQSDSLVPYFR